MTARFKSGGCVLLAIFALAPVRILAQEIKAAQTDAKADAQTQSEATPPAKTEGSEKPSDDQAKKDADGKLISVPGGKALGMSILGNQEAPKALVIVPWKRSELGNGMDVSTKLDDSKQPIDKEVFMRMLSYYEIRSESTRVGAAPAKETSAQAATSANRRKQ